MKILGIESSCDETAAAMIKARKDEMQVSANVILSQIKIHAPYGGVVPEVAARNHIKNILPVIAKALLSEKNLPDVIAVTKGPGLMSSLLIGVETAKTLSYVWRKPLVGVNHLAGHIYANWLGSGQHPDFPALALIVSGGHTELVLMKDHLRFKIIGQTRDDAVGEAFDKVAKILNLGYPGGPAVAQQASAIADSLSPSEKINFPRPMINDNNFDFSFSGIKTSVLYQTQKDKSHQDKIPQYCHAFQQAVVDVLIHKTIKAAQQYRVKSILLAGGVSANTQLRQELGQTIQDKLPKLRYYVPQMHYTTDNAAMIATAGYFMARAKKFTPWHKIKADCNLTL